MIPALIGTMLADKGVKIIGDLFNSGSKAVTDRATDFIKDKTGLDLRSVNTLTPEQIEQIKQLEREHTKDLLALRNEDMANARGMQVEAMRQDDKFTKRFVHYFALMWSVFAAGYITAITFFPIPEQAIRFADTTVGFLLGTIIAGFIGYYYGNHLDSGALK